MKSKLERGFTLIELMIVVAIIGILASIAIPNFIRFQAKSKQSEAKANLKAIFTAKKSELANRGDYDCGFCDWQPELGNIYAYRPDNAIVYASEGDTGDAYGAANVDAPGSTDGTFVVQQFTITAQGNIDADAATDGWQINDKNVLCNGSAGAGDACVDPATANDVVLAVN